MSRFYVSVKKMEEDTSGYKKKRGWNSSRRIKSQHLAVGVTLPGEDGRGQIVEDYVPNCSSLREKKFNPITKFIGSSLG